MASEQADLVRLNFHVPNCSCEVLDGGRVALSATCEGWTKIMHRFFDEAVRRARHRCDHNRCCKVCGIHSDPHKGCILR